MKKIQKFCACFVLILVLAVSAFAGDIPFPGVTVISDTSTTDATIDATSSSSTSDVAAVDPVTETTLALFQSVTSLF